MGQLRDNNKQSIQSSHSESAPERGSTPEGKAVLEFCDRVGCAWSLKASPDKWAAELAERYDRVRLLAELSRAGDWHEERHARGKGPDSPTAAISNWMRRAQADAAKNGTATPKSVPFGSGAARSYQ